MSTTQFEVHVLKDGRWTLNTIHAQRDDALRDVRFIETNTKLPVKVIRETFLPDLTRRETITIYASPKARLYQKPTQRPDALPRKPSHARPQPKTTTRPPLRRQHRSSNGILRSLISAWLSLVIATPTSALVLWILHRGSPIDFQSLSDVSPTLSYFYVAVFLASFLILFRSRMPLEQIFLTLWNQSSNTPPAISAIQVQPRKPNPGVERTEVASPLQERKSLDQTLRDLESANVGANTPRQTPRGPDADETIKISPATSTQVLDSAPPAIDLRDESKETMPDANVITDDLGAEASLSPGEENSIPVEVLLLARFPKSENLPESRTERTQHVALLRDVLTARGGREVTQTEDVAFARFGLPGTAIDAALEIQQRLMDAVIITLIKNPDPNKHAQVSPALLASAEAAFAMTAPGIISAEAGIPAAVSLPYLKVDPLKEQQGESKLVRLTRIPDPTAAAAEAAAREIFNSFCVQILENVAVGQLNPFSRFALGLYLAGVASTIGQEKRLGRDAQLKILREGLESIGNSHDRALAFCTALSSYVQSGRYAEIVDTGMRAMSCKIAGQPDLVNDIQVQLNEWSRPSMRPELPCVFTFLFTDIVGSMAMTLQLGNVAAHRILLIHNAVVRAGITAVGGNEIKHTGDGIMATFPDPASAVTAAIQMQQDIAKYNAENPDASIRIRIGIDTGEAVVEDNDFFGVAVQMTSRICENATQDSIWVSQAVVDACQGRNITFVPRGGFVLKDIQHPKKVYEVGWSLPESARGVSSQPLRPSQQLPAPQSLQPSHG